MLRKLSKVLNFVSTHMFVLVGKKSKLNPPACFDINASGFLDFPVVVLVASRFNFIRSIKKRRQFGS